MENLVVSKGFEILGVYFITIGILLMIVIYMYRFISKITEEHKNEREKWRQVTEKQFESMNNTFKENMSILTALKTILEHRND